MQYSKPELFGLLVTEAQLCRICPDLAEQTAVLSELNGSIDPKVMFVGEAPGRAGADRTRRPFFGDRSGANFQLLLNSIGLSRGDIFIANAVMCSPRSVSDANRKPALSEMRNCSANLTRIIKLIDPPILATLGVVALDALRMIEYHEFKLKTDAGTIRDWNGRKLVPLYHPSPQVIAAQRGLGLQLEHFQALSALITIWDQKEALC